MFSFRLPVCNAHPIDIRTYIICVPMCNRNNEFILREKKMADSNADNWTMGYNLCTEAPPNVITLAKVLLNLRKTSK